VADHPAESLPLLRAVATADEERLIVPQRESRTAASMAGNHDEGIVGLGSLPEPARV